MQGFGPWATLLKTPFDRAVRTHGLNIEKQRLQRSSVAGAGSFHEGRVDSGDDALLGPWLEPTPGERASRTEADEAGQRHAKPDRHENQIGLVRSKPSISREPQTEQ